MPIDGKSVEVRGEVAEVVTPTLTDLLGLGKDIGDGKFAWRVSTFQRLIDFLNLNLDLGITELEGTDIKSTGESGGVKFLREDGDGTCSWVTISGGGDLLAANNLADLASLATSLINLGLSPTDSPQFTNVRFASILGSTNGLTVATFIDSAGSPNFLRVESKADEIELKAWGSSNATLSLNGKGSGVVKSLRDFDVVGDITVSGSVDGRDVAADGAKLDSIEPSATADQTDAEIRAAVDAAIDSNVFTDALLTKLNALIGGTNKLDATVAPGINNDTTEGYEVGSLWIDVTADETYRCVDNTNGAAVWISTGLEVSELAAIAVSGNFTDLVGSLANTQIPAGEIALDKLADVAQYSLLGRLAGSGPPTDLAVGDFSTFSLVSGNTVLGFGFGGAPMLFSADSILMTNAEIRAAVEAATDSNVFTDADHTNLDNQSGVNTGDEVAASEVTAGVVEEATQIETDAGTSGKFVPADKLKAWSRAGQTEFIALVLDGADAVIAAGMKSNMVRIPYGYDIKDWRIISHADGDRAASLATDGIVTIILKSSDYTDPWTSNGSHVTMTLDVATNTGIKNTGTAAASVAANDFLYAEVTATTDTLVKLLDISIEIIRT